jgi:short chain dehydrogenase
LRLGRTATDLAHFQQFISADRPHGLWQAICL